MERSIEQDAIPEIVRFLSGLELFTHFSSEGLTELANALHWVWVGGREVLIRQGEAGDSLYIVYRGRLRVQAEGKRQPTAEIGQGQVVGEISLLIHESRMANVYAVRDSVLLKLSKEAFDRILPKHPEAMMTLARMCVKRVVHRRVSTAEPAKTVSIVMIPAGDNPEFSSFAKKFSEELGKQSHALMLNAENFNQHYGASAAQTPLESDENASIIAWLNEQEANYPTMFYEADPQLTAWTQRCLRQADHILLVGRVGHHSSLNEIETELFRSGRKKQVSVDLILLQDHNAAEIKHTERWLSKRAVDHVYHAHVNADAHLARIVRAVTGNALGLVLCGGGARGLAHVGIFRAIEELKIPIDFVAGSSIGSLFAAAYACGHDYASMLKNVKEHARYFFPWYDYTLPVLSLMRGKSITYELQEIFLDKHIEDLWIPYFCVSSNLTSGQLTVHNRGPVWKSIRTSISLPGVLPPIIDESGEMHADGALINNLPVDLLRSRMKGGKIIAVTFTGSAVPHYESVGEVPSGSGVLLKHWFSHFKSDKRMPNVAETLMASMLMSSKHQEKKMAADADYCVRLDLQKYGLMDVTCYQALADTAYQKAIEYLSQYF